MERKILFRGLDEKGQWHYGDLVHDAFDGNSKNIEVGIRKPNCYPIEVITKTVGRFTGKTKSTNHPMFDDKIKLWEDDIFTVYGSNTKYKVVFENYEWIGVSNEGDDWGKYKYKLSALKKFDIIGNIHDNPELLK